LAGHSHKQSRQDFIFVQMLPFADSDEGDRGSGLMVISIPGSL